MTQSPNGLVCLQIYCITIENFAQHHSSQVQAGKTEISERKKKKKKEEEKKSSLPMDKTDLRMMHGSQDLITYKLSCWTELTESWRRPLPVAQTVGRDWLMSESVAIDLCHPIIHPQNAGAAVWKSRWTTVSHGCKAATPGWKGFNQNESGRPQRWAQSPGEIDRTEVSWTEVRSRRDQEEGAGGAGPSS